MTLILDTNILPRNGDLGGVELSALSALAREVGKDVALPSIVADEFVASRCREAEQVFASLRAAAKKAGAFAHLDVPSLPEIAEIEEHERHQLTERFEVIPLPVSAGAEALRREALRLAPAREGKGARDVAIWLTALDAHRVRGDVIFVSKNTKDFAGPDSGLHQELRREADEVRTGLRYCASIESLIEELGVHEPAFLDLALLRDRTEILIAATEAISASDILYEVQAPIDDDDRSTRFVCSQVDAVPQSIERSRGFRIERRRICVARTRWMFQFGLGVMVRRNHGFVQVSVPIELAATLDLWAALNDEGVLEVEVTSVSRLATSVP